MNMEQLTKTLDDMKKQLAEISARTEILSEVEREVKAPKRAARGTTPSMDAVLKPDAVLREEEIAAVTTQDVKKVHSYLLNLAKRGMAYNVGTEHAPAWIRPLGDETSTQELADQVAYIISTRPMSLAELTAATQARANRISGILWRLNRRENKQPAVNVGTQRRAKWFIPS